MVHSAATIDSIAVAISEGLALKASMQVLYDAQPANLSVPLFDTRGTALGTVRSQGDGVDSVATLTLVVPDRLTVPFGGRRGPSPCRTVGL